MSTRAKFAASIASAGIVAVGWHHYAGVPAAAGVGVPMATTTVTVTQKPTTSSKAATSSKARSSSKATSASSTAGTSSGGGNSNSTSNSNSNTNGSSQTGSGSGNQGSTSGGSTAASTGWKDGTYTGQTVQHPYGSVTVTVTIRGGKIANLTEQVNSDGGQSQYIDQQAVPMVKQEVMAADSAAVSTIGGATFTSAAYLQSLQSALNQA